jgi:hypothetical protein
LLPRQAKAFLVKNKVTFWSDHEEKKIVFQIRVTHRILIKYIKCVDKPDTVEAKLNNSGSNIVEGLAIQSIYNKILQVEAIPVNAS